MSDESVPAGHDWYLREWMAHFGKKQRTLITELRWENKRANQIWHSQQPYKREDVAAVASWLGIEPFELLMRPREAIALRRLREAARQIAAESGAEWDGAPDWAKSSHKPSG